MSCWEFPPGCVPLRVVMINQGQSGATKEERLVRCRGWLSINAPGVAWGFWYHPWNLVCLVELFQSLLTLLSPLLSACGACGVGLVGDMLHGASKVNGMAAGWPIVGGVRSDGCTVDVMQADCACWGPYCCYESPSSGDREIQRRALCFILVASRYAESTCFFFFFSAVFFFVFVFGGLSASCTGRSNKAVLSTWSASRCLWRAF